MIGDAQGGMVSQDPFAYYRAFLDTDSPLSVRMAGVDQHDESDTTSEFRPEAQPAQGQGMQWQTASRPIPCVPALRFANRAIGAPLATITERGSVSTLRSCPRNSPPLRTAENVSPGRAQPTPSLSVDENAVEGIQEEDLLERAVKRTRHGKPDTCHGGATAAGSGASVDRNSSLPQLPGIDDGVETKGVKAFFLGVMANARTRTKSRSSSSATLPMAPIPDHMQYVDRPARTVHKRVQCQKDVSLLEHLDPVSSVSEIQAANRKSSTHFQPSADFLASTSPLPPSSLESDTRSPSAPQVSLPPDPSRLQNGEETSLPVCPVPSEPCHVAVDYVRHAATTFLIRSRDELAARYTPDGSAGHRSDEGSLRDYTRNLSRNASFCSTMSTSYSGTVLGIDLDLQHDFPHSTRRCATPVWFAPNETAVQIQERAKREIPLEVSKAPRSRCVTSSALTSLLPIAAAEGIVHQNLATSKPSFYSPSGNLIEPRDTSFQKPASSPLSHSNLYFSGSPATTTSYHSGTALPSAYSALSAVVDVPPARPTLAPLTTPPLPTAPLPEHLRHHHNYQHVQKSQIGSMSDSELNFHVSSGSEVRGCGGLIKKPSLSPHSGVVQSPTTIKDRSPMSCFRLLGQTSRPRNNKLFAQLTRKTVRYFGTSDISTEKTRRKGKTLKKHRGPPHDTNNSEHTNVEVGAAHLLRICFCQPHDGAGYRTSETGCGGAAMRQQCQSQNENCPSEPQTGTPNARIVVPQDVNIGGKVRPAGRARSDSAVSIGIRVGHVGG